MSVILFVSNILGLNTGKGGHYYTVLDHFRFFSRFMKVKIVCIGHQIPSAFTGIESDVELVKYNKSIDILKAIRKIKLISNEFAAVNCFDANSLLFARISLYRTQKTIYFTKCGGAVRKRYTPALHPDIVFHGEDFQYYSSRGAPAPGRKLLLVPNRVYNPALLSQNSIGIPKQHVRILRIARICKKYEESIYQSIALACKLKSNGIDCSLTLVGYPEDGALVDKLYKELDGVGELFTDEEMTRNASRHIQHADIVVASGRGVMEGAVAKKIIMIAAAGRSYPILLDSEVFHDALHYNFSDRFSTCKVSDNVDKIVRLLSYSDYLIKYYKELGGIAQSYFLLDSVEQLYKDLYSAKRGSSSMYSLKDIAAHCLWFGFDALMRKFK